MDPKQQKIDFQRGTQLSLLRDLSLESAIGHDGQRVSSMALKAALKAIDEFCPAGGECFASQVRLAATAGMSRRVFQRAVSRLIDLSLITCELRRSEYGQVCNHYRIVWNEIASRLTVSATSAAAVSATSEGAGFAPEQTRQKVGDRCATDAPPGQTDAPPGQTDAPPGQTDASAWRTNRNLIRNDPPIDPIDRTAAVGLLEIGSGQPSAAPPDLACKFQSVGFDARDSSDLAGEFKHLTAGELDALLLEFQAAVRSRQIAGRGALLFRLRRGRWPVDGVRTSQELAHREQIKREKEARIRNDHNASEAIKWFRQTHRGKPPDQVDQMIRDHLEKRGLVWPGENDAKICLSGRPVQ